MQGIVSHGAAPNRGLYKILTEGISDNFFINYITDDRIYLFGDVPHLMKTIHNNFEDSAVFFFYRTLMTWSDEWDLMLLIEVAAINPFMHRKGTKERGKAWTDVAEGLQKHSFKVDQRAFQDRYVYLQIKNKQKNAEEKRAPGIAPEESKSRRS